MMTVFKISSLLALSVAFSTVSAQLNSVNTIVGDMKGSHEASPSGVSQFDWGSGPRVGYGNSPPSDWTAFLVWGQVYEQEGGNPSANTRVQLRNMKAYLLRKSDRKWVLLQDTQNIQGAAYREDFANDESKEADVRQENGNSISIRTGGGYNYHYWDEAGRVTIDPNDIAGIFSTIEARAILNDPNGVDDRKDAKYLLSMGADYWESLSAVWRNWETNGDVRPLHTLH